LIGTWKIGQELSLTNQETVLPLTPSKAISPHTVENNVSITCPASDFITRPRPNNVMPQKKTRDRTNVENPKFREPTASYS
jgi:hypothetical protein